MTRVLGPLTEAYFPVPSEICAFQTHLPAWAAANVDYRCMRLFIALALDSITRDELKRVLEPIRSGVDSLRWTTPESWHITLQFLGSTTPQQLTCLLTALPRVKRPAILVRLGKVGCFEHAGVLFLEAHLSAELLILQNEVVQATSICGFVPEARAYTPHITLARSRDGKSRGKLKRVLELATQAMPRIAPFRADEFRLYHSLAGAESSPYEVLSRFPLVASEARGRRPIGPS
jgi:RNA 2',3'-cyclic 3'-phosphodiesterase